MNCITLQATKFVNLPQGDETIGWRMYDNHGQTYDNTLESLVTEDLELLKIALESTDQQVLDMLSMMQEISKGIEINGNFYDWDQVKHLWTDIH